MLVVSILCLGVAAGLLALTIFGDTVSLVVPLSVFFTVGFGLQLVHGLRAAIPANAEKRAEARAAGRGATALVTGIKGTGTLINDERIYDIDLVVVPTDRRPYRTTMSQGVDPIVGPRFEPGTTVSVVRIKADDPKVVWDPEGTPREINPITVAGAGEWDPMEGLPPGTQPKKRGPWKGLALFLLFLAVGAGTYFGAGYVIDVFVPEATVEDAAEEAEEAALAFHEDIGALEELLEHVYDEFGTSRTSEIHVFADHVSLTLESREAPRYWDEISFRGESATSQRAASPQPDPEDIFEIWDVDWSVIPGLYEHALSVAPPVLQDDVKFVFFYVRKPFYFAVEDTGAELQIRMHLSNDYESIYIDADEHGNVHHESID